MGYSINKKNRYLTLVAAALPTCLKRKISRLLFKTQRLRDSFCGIDEFEIRSFSQEGEDVILHRINPNKKNGFYVDVGAHHPRRFSNTYMFYKRGWRGINIEPDPESAGIFRKERSMDVNLQIGISAQPGKMKYYKFNESAMNTFDSNLAKEIIDSSVYTLLETIDIQLERLDDILDSYLPENTEIDFLSIDVEGFDLSVLESNNWRIYRPRVVLAEERGASVAEAVDGEVSSFLHQQGYELFAKTFNTLFFRDKQSESRNQ